MVRGLDTGLPAMKALGVREIIAHLEGRYGRDEALERARRATRQFAKRQLTWFRHQAPDWPRIETLDPDEQWRALSAFVESAP